MIHCYICRLFSKKTFHSGSDNFSLVWIETIGLLFSCPVCLHWQISVECWEKEENTDRHSTGTQKKIWDQVFCAIWGETTTLCKFCVFNPFRTKMSMWDPFTKKQLCLLFILVRNHWKKLRMVQEKFNYHLEKSGWYSSSTFCDWLETRLPHSSGMKTMTIFLSQ